MKAIDGPDNIFPRNHCIIYISNKTENRYSYINACFLGHSETIYNFIISNARAIIQVSV